MQQQPQQRVLRLQQQPQQPLLQVLQHRPPVQQLQKLLQLEVQQPLLLVSNRNRY